MQTPVPPSERRNPRLRIHPRFTHKVEADGAILLVADADWVLLEGGLSSDVLGCVDGTSTAFDVASKLSADQRPETVHFAVLRLIQDEVLTEREPSWSDQPAPDGHEVAGRLRDAWRLRGSEPVAVVPMSSDEVLLLTEDYLEPKLRSKVASLLDGGWSTVRLARVAAWTAWIGPTLSKTSDVCVSCFQSRLRVNFSAHALMRSLLRDAVGMALRTPRDAGVFSLWPTMPSAAFETLASAIVEAAGAGATLQVLPVLGGAPSRHSVPTLPDCPACGDPTLVPPGADFDLRSRTRVGGSGGGYRICSPRETLGRFESLVDPLMGAVRRVEPVHVAASPLIHVYTANHAGTLAASSVTALKHDARDRGGGKGVTDLDARVSALCESLERFSAVYRGTEPTRRARASELRDEALHPRDLLLFSADQYERRGTWNSGLAGRFQWVPEPYEDQVLSWSPVKSLVTDRIHWAPSSFLYHGYTGDGRRFARADSNGLAGGNCPEEAMLQGFLELVERDAVALWWYNRARVPAFDLEDSVEDPYVREVIDFYPTIERRVWALDLTTDLDIPCVAALSARVDAPPDDVIFGFGCHPDPAVAVRRALSELNQMLPAVLRSPAERERQMLPEFADALRWWDTATVTEHPYLEPAKDKSPRSGAGADLPEDLTEILVHCVSQATRVGVDVLAHDLTRPDVKLSVVKVVAPGLRHFWRRTGPGRLYDIPVQIGWMERTLLEGELNPVSMFV